MALCYVLIPFKDGEDFLATCIESLLPQLTDGVEVVLVDDGSRIKAAENPLLQPFLKDDRVHLLGHEFNLGPAQARNTGLAWCKEAGAQIVILLDSDCLAKPGFVEAHIRLHRENSDQTCIGGAIQGQGEGVWARLDAVMSWFTSIPGTPARIVNEPYHLPTTNMSLRMSNLPAPDQTFNPRLRTGEDVAFIKDIRRRGETILFSPEPEIIHSDRSSAHGFFKHQHRWGLHTYVVRFGEENLSPWCRGLFVLSFILGLPVYIVLMTVLNIAPWLQRSPGYLMYIPILLLLYGVKGISVLFGAINPALALYPKSEVVLENRTGS